MTPRRRPRRRRGSASPAAPASCPTACAARPGPPRSRRGCAAATARSPAPCGCVARRSSVQLDPSASVTNRISSPSPPASPASSTWTTRLSATSSNALDHGVEVARTEAHAAAVERGVGAAADDARAVVGERHPVAVAPHAGEVLEVGGAVPACRRRSPQNPTGIDGIGLVMTSSPVTPGGQTAPSGVNASTAQPSRRPPISPAAPAAAATTPMNAVQTSVPPQIEVTGTPTTSPTQRNPSAGSGAPVEPTQRSALRRRLDAGLAARHQERRRRRRTPSCRCRRRRPTACAATATPGRRRRARSSSRSSRPDTR